MKITHFSFIFSYRVNHESGYCSTQEGLDDDEQFGNWSFHMASVKRCSLSTWASHLKHYAKYFCSTSQIKKLSAISVNERKYTSFLF